MIDKALLFSSFLLSSHIFAADNSLTELEKAQGWKLLFDGKSMNQWLNYNKQTLSSNWKIEDNAMYKSKAGGDIVTKKSYKNFEFKLEWKISEKGNSGIFVRVDSSGKRIYSKSIEIQVLDNSTDPKPVHSSGSVYDMIAAPKESQKPQGAWNQVHIICKDQHIIVFQNGVKAADFIIGSPEWDSLLKASKFAKWQGFGLAQSGPIGLQEHGNPVWFKNLKVRELK